MAANRIKTHGDFLDEIVAEKRLQINPNDLPDAFELHTDIVHEYWSRTSKYLVDVIVPYILEKNCDPALLKADTKKQQQLKRPLI